MDKIKPDEFLLRQPSFPESCETDDFYLELANRLLQSMSAHAFAASMPVALLKRVALTLTDYMQDIVSDAGLWRSFVDATANCTAGQCLSMNYLTIMSITS